MFTIPWLIVKDLPKIEAYWILSHEIPNSLQGLTFDKNQSQIRLSVFLVSIRKSTFLIE